MESLLKSAITGNRVRELNEEDALRVAATKDVRGLLALKVALQAESHFRLLWVRLIALVSVAALGTVLQVHIDDPGPVVVSLVIVVVMAYIAGAVFALVAAERIRTNAELTDEWIALIDYRLAQLASQG